MKQIIITLLITLLCINTAIAETEVLHDRISNSICGYPGGECTDTLSASISGVVTTTVYVTANFRDGGCNQACYGTKMEAKVWSSHCNCYPYQWWTWGNCGVSTTQSIVKSTSGARNIFVRARKAGGDGLMSPYTVDLTVVYSTEPGFTISGNANCCDYVNLYIKSGVDYIVCQNDTTGETYSFNVFNTTEYKLVFPDSSEYEFYVEGNNIEYNHDGCAYMTIFLKDYCGNKMTNTSVDIYKSDAGATSSYEFVNNYQNTNPINLLVSDIGIGKMLDIYFDTDMGTYHKIDYCGLKTINILHPLKSWSINFGAFDLDTHEPIENIKMVVNQTCKPDPSRLLTTHGFTDASGYKMFQGLSAQRVSIRMDNDLYKGDRFWVDGLGDAFCTNHVIDTYLNLSGDYPEDHNETENMTLGCNIKFKDISGHVDNHINDTDAYVDLYYQNGNCSATLKFQRLYGTYWMTKESYNIVALDSGYERILNSNFSQYDSCYRAIMTASECECNSTLSLYVTNETVQEEEHYENLTTYIRFKHQIGNGQVDYRSDVSINAYAYTNYSAYLLNINLTLYEQTNQISTVSLNWADFAGANPKWYYEWSPNVNYDIGKNYTVIMTGYNGLNLTADDVWTSNIRNNRLTLYVKDSHNNPLNYATVFIENWGSVALESQTEIEIEGFGNGDVQYKATKSGYTSSIWNTVTLTDNDESVTCILTKETTDRITSYKMKNDEIKSFFIPIMYLLLVFMLVGAVMYSFGKV